MPRTTRTTHRTTPPLLAALVLAVGGCAGLPRIDPSGERLFVFPNNAPAVPAPGVPGNAGNLAAPPVVGSGTSSGCPLCPFGNCGLGNCGLGDCGLGDCCLGSLGSLGGLCPLDGSCCDIFSSRSPTVPPPGPAVAAPLAAAAPRTVLPDADETLSITPERILAPVGSEVVLKAGVCANNGYLRTNRRIDWTLGGEGAGQFVNIGERGEMDILRLPWQRPQKVDNTYAVGYTAPFHTCLHRGTADPSDDTQIRPGEAWVTVTSASEGASYVTAYAPESRHWEARRATATIYWVDARWQYPPEAVVQLGQSHTLTTVVTRESDGAPVAGYVVRYEALGGAATQLGYEGGQVAEAVTDSEGRASIQITPTDDQPGAARVGVTVVRPAQSAPMPSPRLELGSGETSVTWSATGSPTPFLPGDPSTPSTTIPPVPFEPAPDDRPTPPPTGPSLGTPQLEVTLRRDSLGPIRVNDSIPVTITVRNAGDAPATGIELRDAFDRGLTNAGDIDGEFEIKYPSFPDLAPGESEVVPLEFTAIAPGRQCHRVTVSAPGAQPAVERQCFDVEAAAPPPATQLRVDAEGELQREVGQPYRFRARVTNNGSVTAEGHTVEIWHDADGTLRPTLATEGNVALERGFRWTLPPLAPGDSRRFEVEYDTVTPTVQSKVTVFVEGPDTETITETRAVEIVAPRGDAAPALPPAAGSPLRPSISSTANPAQAGRPAALNVLIENTSAQTLRDVDFRLTFPPQIRPGLSPATSQLPFRANQNTLQFDPIPELRPGQPIRLTVPYEPLTQGEVRVLLEARSADLEGIQSAEAPISIRAR